MFGVILGSREWREANAILLRTIKASVQEKTWDGYYKKGLAYLEWCKDMGVEGRWREDTVVAAYIAWLGVSRKWNGVRVEMEAVKAWFKLQGADYPNGAEVVGRAMMGVRKMQKGRVAKKEPVRLWMLRKIARRVQGVKGVRNLVLFLLGFFVLLRVSELVRLRWCDVYWSGKGALVRVRRSKGASQAEWWPLVFHEEEGICPVLCLNLWWRICGKKEGKEFIFPGRVLGNHLSHSQVRRVIKGELESVGVRGDRFSSHSLRRGGAQLLDMRQAPLQELQGLGGWRSDSAPFEYLGTRLGAKFSAANRLARRYNLCFLFCVHRRMRGQRGGGLRSCCVGGMPRKMLYQ